MLHTSLEPEEQLQTKFIPYFNTTQFKITIDLILLDAEGVLEAFFLMKAATFVSGLFVLSMQTIDIYRWAFESLKCPCRWRRVPIVHCPVSPHHNAGVVCGQYS